MESAPGAKDGKMVRRIHKVEHRRHEDMWQRQVETVAVAGEAVDYCGPDCGCPIEQPN